MRIKVKNSRSFFKFLIFKEFSSALKFAKYIQVVFKEFKE